MPASTDSWLLIKKENSHDDPIYCCAWARTNPSGDSMEKPQDFIVTGGLDSLVKIWKFENNKLDLLHTLTDHSMAVVCIAVSPDGHTLATTSLDGSLLIWDLISGTKVHNIQTSSTDVWKVSFSPDGLHVVSGSHTGKLIIYNIEKGNTIKTLDTRGKFALSVAWSPNGKYISSGAVDGVVSIFDVAQGKLLHTIEAHTKPVRCVAFSPSSRILISASTDGEVKLFDVASANEQGSYKDNCWVHCARYSPDGSRVATAGDGGVRLFASGMKLMHTFQDHTDSVVDLQFNMDANKLVSVSKDKSINIYSCPVPPKNNC